MNFNRFFIDTALIILLLAMFAMPVGSIGLLSVDSEVVDEYLAKDEHSEGIVSGMMDVRAISNSKQDVEECLCECDCPVCESSPSNQ